MNQICLRTMSHDVSIVQPPNDIARVVCDGPDVPLGDRSILMLRSAYLVFKISGEPRWESGT